MCNTYRIVVAVVCPILLLGALCMPVPGWGLTLEEAKAQGLVGEKPNGYLGVVSSAGLCRRPGIGQRHQPEAPTNL